MTARGGAMPPTVWAIAFGIFAQGTSELMLAGLLPGMASDLGVTIPQAGLLISAFALGMVVGAPALAVLSLRWPRKLALLAFLAAFTVSHILSALTDSYGLLFVMRFLGAFAYAGFWAVGGSAAMALAGEERRGRAMSIVTGGLTVATVLGLPAGTWIGQRLGWRGAFWMVAALCLIAAIVIVTVVPGLRPGQPTSVRSELRGLHQPRLWLSYAMTAASKAALLGTFCYLGTMLIEIAGLDAGWVPAVLLGYGLGALVGIAMGGGFADRYPRATLGVGFTGLLVASLLIALAARHAGAVTVLVVLLGMVGFGVSPALNSRVLALAPDAPTLAVSGTVSSFNLGIALGPWLGGLALTAGYDYSAIPAIGAAIAGLALLLWVGDLALGSWTRSLRLGIKQHAASRLPEDAAPRRVTDATGTAES
ncbi:Cmx/CmrA family chloramphenicol efflux MFS transporter [Micropruina sp.]|uniref:Cmx/CmrA family chloramphenicol efflux MFS transporter n=1 Tax=Micropruina sp. TaxID=2737536 RepID=UPI0039E33C3B